jgi:hypothetical protein
MDCVSYHFFDSTGTRTLVQWFPVTNDFPVDSYLTNNNLAAGQFRNNSGGVDHTSSS